jgi:hypothetical protein
VEGGCGKTLVARQQTNLDCSERGIHRAIASSPVRDKGYVRKSPSLLVEFFWKGVRTQLRSTVPKQRKRSDGSSDESDRNSIYIVECHLAC